MGAQKSAGVRAAGSAGRRRELEAACTCPRVRGAYFGACDGAARQVFDRYNRRRVDTRAAAEYYVLFRLAQMGLLAVPATSPGGELVACSARGTRVALLRVRVPTARGDFEVELAAERSARNRAYVFVELPRRAGQEPACFVVPAAVVAAEAPETPSASGRIQP